MNTFQIPRDVFLVTFFDGECELHDIYLKESEALLACRNFFLELGHDIIGKQYYHGGAFDEGSLFRLNLDGKIYRCEIVPKPLWRRAPVRGNWIHKQPERLKG